MGIAGQLFLQLAVILVTGRCVGFALRRLRQPQVVGEMVAGLRLGPSLFGLLAPRLQEAIFPVTKTMTGSSGTITTAHPSTTVLFAVGQLGLILYMFLVGARLDTKALGVHRSDAGRISLTGIAFPAIAGATMGIAFANNEHLFPARISHGQAALFLASALAVTAFPVLARILTDSGAAQTRVGTLALSAAAFDDAVAWGLLALTLALAEGSSGGAIVTIAGTLLFVAFMVVIGRPILRRFDSAAGAALGSGQLIGLLVVMLGCAALTEWIGVHAVFGAFVAGAALPRGRLTERLTVMLEGTTVTILLPVFFVYAGLKTRIGLLDDWSMLWILAAIIFLAFACKGGGCLLAMRFGGASWREAGAVGALMNARGLMELTFISIALERGLITPTLYTMLALMALATTMAAPPLFAWLHQPEPAHSLAPALSSARPVASP
jgi:Kef-type K+ transport system membrane component KefB